MTHKTDSDGNPLNHHRQSSQASEDQDPLLQLPDSWMQPSFRDALEVCTLLRTFVGHDDGYLKVKREPDGDDIHLTWIWTLGKWSRHYVYVRCAHVQLAWGLGLLQGKIEQVDMGLRHPTPDRYGR